MQCRERIGYAIEENERGPAVLPKIRNREKKGSVQKRRIRDRTTHAAQTAERRGADLQQRKRRLAVETDEVR